jgi:hypothetical protein
MIAVASCSSEEPGPSTPAVSYAKDVQPILMAKCSPCHAGSSQGHHNIATTYEDAKKPVTSLQFDDCWTDYANAAGPKTIGECSVLLTRAGKMPASAACDAPTPPDPSKCTTKAEQDILAAWVAGGMAP